MFSVLLYDLTKVCFLNGASGLNVRKNIHFESELFEEITKFNEGGAPFDSVIYIVLCYIELVESTQFLYYIFLLICILKCLVSCKCTEYRSAEIQT